MVVSCIAIDFACVCIDQLYGLLIYRNHKILSINYAVSYYYYCQCKVYLYLKFLGIEMLNQV